MKLIKVNLYKALFTWFFHHGHQIFICKKYMKSTNLLSHFFNELFAKLFLHVSVQESEVNQAILRNTFYWGENGPINKQTNRIVT